MPKLSADVVTRICDHMNDDHDDAVLAYARDLAGITDAHAARMASIDPRGMDLTVETPAGPRTARVTFDHELADGDDARQTLIALARGGADHSA